MQRLLIILGLVCIPFYEILLKALPFAASTATDSRCTKEILAMIFALSLGLLAVFYGKIKPFRNKWFLLIPVYLLFNLVMAPHFDMFINNVESGDFYFWKPFAEVLCFGLMIIAISSAEIDFDEILKVMVICGTVMAGYVILQRMGLDQFWIPREGGDLANVRGRVLGGNLGQPTLVSSWMVMMVPLAFYLRKYWMAFLIIVACLLTQGAMVAMALGCIFLIRMYYCEDARWGQFIIGGIIVCGIIISGLLISNHSLRNKAIGRMDGRYAVWKNVVKDIRTGAIDGVHKYPMTGVGLGRFAFIFPDKNKSQFMQAHNDSLEFIYNCGLVGAFLLFAGLFFMFQNLHMSQLSFSVLLSFIALFFCSLGSFPFQLGAHQFYAAILVGFLNNDLINRRVR